MKKFLLCVAAAALAFGASAASKRLASLTNVYSSQSEKAVYAYDEQGRLVSVDGPEETYTFDYSKLAEKQLTITCKDKNYPEVYTYVMTLNDEGLVVKGVEYEDGMPDDGTYNFEYTGGRLTNFKYIQPDETEETRITYDADGSIVKIEEIDGNSASESRVITFEYDGKKNVGGLALYDDLYSVDIDDFQMAAFAGFMGKVPAELPVKSVSVDTYGSETETYGWTLDADGYPTKLAVSDEGGYGSTYEFAWEENLSGVAGVEAEVAGVSKFYNVHGLEVGADAKGLVIERRADGSVVKTIRR